MVKTSNLTADVNQERLHELGVLKWDIWQKSVSNTDTYDIQETCYFLTGDFIVTPEGG